MPNTISVSRFSKENILALLFLKNAYTNNNALIDTATGQWDTNDFMVRHAVDRLRNDGFPAPLHTSLINLSANHLTTLQQVVTALDHATLNRLGSVATAANVGGLTVPNSTTGMKAIDLLKTVFTTLDVQGNAVQPLLDFPGDNIMQRDRPWARASAQSRRTIQAQPQFISRSGLALLDANVANGMGGKDIIGYVWDMGFQQSGNHDEVMVLIKKGASGTSEIMIGNILTNQYQVWETNIANRDLLNVVALWGESLAYNRIRDLTSNTGATAAGNAVLRLSDVLPRQTSGTFLKPITMVAETADIPNEDFVSRSIRENA